MKRFQESNWLVKLFRYRHYLYIPFKWLYFKYLKSFYVIDDLSLKKESVEAISFRKLIKQYGFKKTIKNLFKGNIKCELWSLLVGIAQSDMKWYFTMDEVKSKFGLLDNDVIDDVDDTEYWKGID